MLVGQQFCGQVIQGDQLILHVLNVFNKFAVVESLQVQDERFQNRFRFSGRPPICVCNSARGGAGRVINQHHTYRYAGKYVG